ncbi:unnamed protein product [Bursaphelenchus xylophilus]|uniref:Signal peptidase complex subunit 3 n=1 Tax=Bursaphelenchus xylophilus TaxID=6326 RepID=A0A1I7RQT6_BURXY|nr:unnamed protein product [Bursaphelenchus xylophilus]CAG9113264.1 unnamed protein product [Bursaphelenchus xylophilus]
MHSFLSRLNALFTFLSSVLAAATALVFIQTLFLNYTVPIDVKVENVKLKPIRDVTGKSDIATAGFHLHADLTPIFNWNVRLAYVWLQAEYATEERPINQLIIWDTYLKRFEDTVLNRKIAKPPISNQFVDYGNNLRGRNVTFTLHWTVVPNAGWLRNVLDQEGSTSVRLPLEYNW